jgi:stage II sporulation protein D
LFADKQSGSALFVVTEGKYELDVYDGNPISLTKDDPVIFAFYNGKVAVRTNSQSFSCDSLVVRGITEKDVFSLRITGIPSAKQIYGGDLQCLPDMGKLILLNICDIEQYIAGVVKAEGGSGRNIEYSKSQALLVRSYMYKYFQRHSLDRYNLCDNTHCQAFYGITTDSVILKAALETKGMVILDHDSVIVTSAFHSNCGGETSVSEDVWLAGYPYLKKVIDPYCTSSRNAKWSKTIPLAEWSGYLKRNGYMAGKSNPSVYNFSQITRL